MTPAALAFVLNGVALVTIVRARGATRHARARLELVADAEHELRGSLTALGLLVATLRGADRDPLEAQLDRAGAGLADLQLARAGRPLLTRAPGCSASEQQELSLDRLVRSGAAGAERLAAKQGRRVLVRGGAGVVRGDRRRLAQALGILLENALEHGHGDVAVRAERRGGRAVVEVVNAAREQPSGSKTAGRGRGLRIAARAAHASGAAVAYGGRSGLRTATLEMPGARRDA